MRHGWQPKPKTRPTPKNQRTAERRALIVPARLAWKDQRGLSRFASVVTRDVSDYGVFVECTSPLSIPLYRLVQFQIESAVHDLCELPEPLRQGRILSAVYRISQPSATAGYGLALRLMVDPKRQAAASPEAARATA